MNSTSPPIFQLRKPLSPLVLEPLKAVAQTANSLGFSYFLAGATARDLILENVFGRPPGRLTRDLDFGFALSDWNQFETLKKTLIATGRFEPDRAIQRVLYLHSANIKIGVDLIPFGRIQDGSNISWPPRNDFVMNVAGFREALESASRLPRCGYRCSGYYCPPGLGESAHVSSEAPLLFSRCGRDRSARGSDRREVSSNETRGGVPSDPRD